MPSLAKILRAAADTTRLRILLLLQVEELSVAELQEILAMGQSTISTHLSQLKQAGLLEDRRTGKSNLYRLAAAEGSGQLHPVSIPLEGESENSPGQAEHSSGKRPRQRNASRRGAANGASSSPVAIAAEPAGALASQDHTFLAGLLTRAAAEIPEASSDAAAMRRVLRKRQDKMRAFFDSVAGRLGRDYVPGKSWKSLAEALLRLMPPMTIADLGAGEGAFALLLAQRAKKVIAVDSSARMIDVGREQAARHGVDNIDFRLGDIEELPIGSDEVDLVFFSQSLHHALHPARALAEAWRILVPGGRVAILDLGRHRFAEARELYADQWLGFSEAGLESMLERAGFVNVRASIVDKEPESPQFQTLLAVGDKPQ